MRAPDVNGISGLPTCLNSLTRLPYPVTAQLFIIHSRHFDMNINSIQQWTRDSFLIFCHKRRGAGTGFLRVAIIAARAGYTQYYDFLETDFGYKSQATTTPKMNVDEAVSIM